MHSNSDESDAKLRQVFLDVADGEDLVFTEEHDNAIHGLAEVDGELWTVYDQDSIICQHLYADVV